MPNDLRDKIAEALGWSVKDTQGFALAALREFVRARHPKLTQEIDDVIRRGGHITET
jgi:hypothetical protein